MNRRLSLEERHSLAEQRAARQRELLEQAATLHQQIAERAQEYAQIAADDPRTPPTERIGAQIDRLSAAALALELAARLLQTDDPDSQPIRNGQPQPSARELHAELGSALGRWYRAGAGWWEARTVWRPRIAIEHDPDTREIEINVAWWPFGPYFYRHWRQEGKQHTQYLGTERPDDYPQDTDLPLPEPQPISDLGPLVVQGRDLARRLQTTLDQATGKQHQQRVRHALRRAIQRTLRRLRAEGHQPPTESTDEEAQAPASTGDEQAQTPSLPPLQSVLVGRSTKAHLTIDNQITLCGFHLDTITSPAPSFIELHDCPRCAQQARAIGYILP
jgi:hypothetical protein